MTQNLLSNDPLISCSRCRLRSFSRLVKPNSPSSSITAREFISSACPGSGAATWHQGDKVHSHKSIMDASRGSRARSIERGGEGAQQMLGPEDFLEALR